MSLPYVLLMYVQRMVHGRRFEHLGNLGLMSLASFLERRGYEAAVFTGITTDAVSVFEDESARRPVLAVGLYCDYDNQTAVESLSRLLKERYGVHVLVGGPQAMHLSEAFLRSSRCDALVRGDGEQTLVELLGRIVSGERSLSDIKGVACLDEQDCTGVVAERPLLDDLDPLPFANTSRILRAPHKQNLSIISARGCPFRCAFCFEGGNTRTLRLRGVEKVIEEIRLGLEKYPEANYVWFVDDIFTLGYERTARFCEALAGLREKRDFVWFCEGHAGILSKWPRLIPMMKDSGLVRMQIGMESGVDRALEAYGKQATVAQIEEVIHRCWEADLPQLAGNFIIGGAHETPETLELTAQHAEKLLVATPGLLDISTTFVIPLPNTAISNCPGKFGIKLLDAESLTSLEDFPVTEAERLTRDDLCRARARFLERVLHTMRRLFEEGRIPHERIETHVRLAMQYGISSTWHKYVYSRDAFAARYYPLLVATSAKRLQEILPDQLGDWHPCRTFDMIRDINWSPGTPRLDGAVLSSMEYETLSLCDGRLSLREICEQIAGKPVEANQENNTLPLLRETLKHFADRRRILFFPP